MKSTTGRTRRKAEEEWTSLLPREPPQLQQLLQSSSDNESVWKLGVLVDTHWKFLNFKKKLWLWPASLSLYLEELGRRKNLLQYSVGEKGHQDDQGMEAAWAKEIQRAACVIQTTLQECSTVFFNCIRVKCTEEKSWTISSTYMFVRK